MTIAPDIRFPPPTVTEGPALIPPRSRLDGPVTTRRLRRTLAGYAVLAGTGAALGRWGRGRAVNAGTGMVLPGAGYLTAGKPGRFLATQAGFATSLGLWLGSGNVLAPIAVWAGTAVTAARHEVRVPTAKTAVPLAAAAGLGVAVVLRRRAFRKALARRGARNEYLRQLQNPTTSVVEFPRSAPTPEVPELDAEQVAQMRFALDRALQPVPDFAGFDRIDQFQTSSIRYQVAICGYALTSVQYSHTPAFHGYLSLGQRNTIAKWQERICWAFWSKESLWGHLRYNPDPIPRDDIMVSGWLANLIAGYTATTGDHRYAEPGSISFRHPRGMRYDYDLHSLTKILADNFAASSFGLFPCEPNWIYALCNGFGVLPLPIHDRLYGTDHAAAVLPGFRRGFEEEFLSVDGRTIGLRSKWTGLTVPAMTSVLSDASVIWQLAPVFPDIARRQWEILRHEKLAVGADGRLDAELSGWDNIDTGNYRRSNVGALLWVKAAATELGDTEIAAAAAARLAVEGRPVVERGVRRLAAASVQANLGQLLAGTGRANAHFDRVNRPLPEAWARGPILDEASYPHVLVARAVTDGAALDLVLLPGDGAGRFSLGLDRLRPGSTYRVRGGVEESVVAAADGTARIQVDLDGRHEVRITPDAS
ncbi:linalool dehydratase/isomerase domain-containing protein [Nocardia coubleae]|uniref:Linalool dehydratase/isomerase domain-containing protein n=1 Tax=Nocardia coubleae TaxID=356147 RepID=A0A846W201_9NOCA|nr:hypothetical protein [Nocardia coubleae]NKX86840.1 hypothetical protein [Nocardia coubleae]